MIDTDCVILDIDVMHYLDGANFALRSFFQRNEYRLIRLRDTL